MTRGLRRQGAVHAALAVGAVFVLLPFVVMVLTSLHPDREVLSGGLLTGTWTLDNYSTALREVPWARYYLNGAIVTVAIFLGQVASSVPAAYALARLRFRGRSAGMALVLVCLMIPAQVTAIPVYLLLSKVGMVDTRTALIVPFVGSAFGIFLFRQFLLSVPQSLFDAARVDGVSEMGMAWRVAWPVLKPAVVAFGVFSVATHWNDFAWPTFVLRSTDAATVPYGIARFAGEAGAAGGGTPVSYGAQMAAATLAIVPLLVGFVLAQRQFVRGMTFTGVRG
jgi:multiple sugar transport system permease protein